MTRTSAERAGSRHPAGVRRALTAVLSLVAALAVTVTIEVAGVDLRPGGGVPVAEACDELQVPSLGLSRCVVPGAQAEIDAGHVVRVTFLSSPQVHWLAGHRTSHGATFSSLTSLRIGATIRYRGQVFVVTDYRLVDRFRPDSIAGWVSSDTPSVVLQTSASGVYVHVWRSVAFVPSMPLVAVAPPPVPH